MKAMPEYPRNEYRLMNLRKIIGQMPSQTMVKEGAATVAIYNIYHQEVYELMRQILKSVDEANQTAETKNAQQNDSDAPPLDKAVESFAAYATAAAIHQAAGGKLTWDDVVQTLGKRYDLDQFPNPETISQEKAKRVGQTQETISITLPGNYSDPEYCLGQGRHFIRRTDNDKKRFQYLGPKGWTYQSESILYFQNQSYAEAVLAILPQPEVTRDGPHEPCVNGWSSAFAHSLLDTAGYRISTRRDDETRDYCNDGSWGNSDPVTYKTLQEALREMDKVVAALSPAGSVVKDPGSVTFREMGQALGTLIADAKKQQTEDAKGWSEPEITANWDKQFIIRRTHLDEHRWQWLSNGEWSDSIGNPDTFPTYAEALTAKAKRLAADFQKVIDIIVENRTAAAGVLSGLAIDLHSVKKQPESKSPQASVASESDETDVPPTTPDWVRESL